MTLQRLSIISIVIIILIAACRPAMITQENAIGFDYPIIEADQTYRLTMAQFYNDLRQSRLFPEGGIIPSEAVKDVLDSILCDTLDGLEAAEVRLEDNYEIYRQYRMRYREKLINSYLEEFVYSKVEIDSQAVVDFYFSRPDLFQKKEQVMVYHILISVKGLLYGPDSLKYQTLPISDVEVAAEKKAKEVWSMIDSAEKFKEIAARDSDDTTNGGLIGWAERGKYLKPFDSVAFSLKPGEWSQPYEDSYGWHIIYVEDHLPERIPPIDSLIYQEAVANFRIAQANQIGVELMDTLLSDVDIVYNERLLDTNLYFVDVKEWVAIVNGQDTIDCNDARGPELSFRRQFGVDNTTPEMKKEMLIRPAQIFAIAQAARRTGIDTLPEVVAEERLLMQKYTKQIIKNSYAIDPYWKAPDSAVVQYYQQNLSKFQPAKPMQVQHIIIQDSLFGDFLRDQAMSGYDFLDLAEEHYPGEKEVRRDLADLGWISEEDVSKEFWRGASLTGIGEVSHPVRTEYGYHIIKVLNRLERKSVDQVKPEIQMVLKNQEKKRLAQAHLNDLIKKYKVKFPGKVVPMHLEPLEMRMSMN